MNRHVVFAAALAVGLLGSGILGCSGGDAPDLVPAAGIVEYKGKPVDGASVTFIPEKGPAAAGVTNAEGRFRLATNGIDGAAPGKHTVTVVKMEGEITQQIDTSDLEKARTMSVNAAANTPRHLLPEKYADPRQSSLSVEVPAEGSDAISLQLN